MKKKKYLCLLFTFIAVIVFCLPASSVPAKTYDFSSLYLQVDVPDDTIVLTKETQIDDALWKAAGITDVASEKENFDTMGAQAIFYDPATSTTVRLLQKTSSKSKSIFHLAELSEQELADFYDTMTSTDDSATASIKSYEQGETLFFRYEINTTAGLTEIIYATILNGTMISFDTYTESSKDVINEEYLQSLVKNTHITQMLNKEEVRKSEMTSTIIMIVFLVLAAIVIGLLVHRAKKKNKKLAVLRNQKAEKMSVFFREQREKEKQHIKDPRLFANDTVYTEAVIKQFAIYNLFMKQIKMWLISGVVFILLLAVLSQSSNGTIKLAIGIILVIVFIYVQTVQIEKFVKRTMKLYGKKEAEINFQFYEDYFTVKENNSTTKYPYLQLTDIRESKDFIYLYRSTEHAFYIKKDNFEDFNAFKAFITKKM